MRIVLQVLVAVVMAGPLWAYNPHAKRDVVAGVMPPELEGLELSENLGESIDLDLNFVDEQGQPVRLAQYFGNKPVLMALVYYGCPNLCNFQLNGLTQAMRQMRLQAGRDYEFVTVSIHPEEGPELAAEKKANHIQELGRPVAAKGWHLLTGVQENIKNLAQQVGFAYKWSQKTKQYAHAAMTYVLTPEGVISRYLYGVQFEPQTLRLSLVEASSSKVADVIDRILLFCFQFDPSLNKYTL